MTFIHNNTVFLYYWYKNMHLNMLNEGHFYEQHGWIRGEIQMSYNTNWQETNTKSNSKFIYISPSFILLWKHNTNNNFTPFFLGVNGFKEPRNIFLQITYGSKYYSFLYKTCSLQGWIYLMLCLDIIRKASKLKTKIINLI